VETDSHDRPEPAEQPEQPEQPEPPEQRAAFEGAGELAKRFAAAGLELGDACLAAVVVVLARFEAGRPPSVVARHTARHPGGALRRLDLGWDEHERFDALGGRVRAAVDARGPSKLRDAAWAVTWEEAGATPAAVAAGHDVELKLTRRGDVIDVAARSAPALEERVASVLRSLEVLLRDSAQRPAHPVGRLELLDPSLRERLLALSHGPRAERPGPVTVDRRVAERARVHPDRAAVIVDRDGAEGALSYRDLTDRADRIAEVLYRRGVLTDEPVGVLAERSPARVAALLGVMRAGGAVLALDRGAGHDHHERLLEHAQCRFCLTDAPRSTGEVLSDARVLSIDDLLFEGDPDGAPELEPDGETVAWAAWRHTADGRWLGVLIPHRAALSRADALARTVGLEPGERLGTVADPDEEGGLLELVWALGVGATLVLLDPDPQTLPARLTDAGVDALSAPAQTWERLLASGWTPPAGFRALCTDAITPGLAAALRGREAALWSLYGAPEGGTWATIEPHRASEDAGTSQRVIGRPLPHTSAYVLDAEHRLLPPLAVGALWLAGDGVARGYANRRALTRERFVPDPYRDEGGARRVATGELARWSADGRLQLVGRIDDPLRATPPPTPAVDPTRAPTRALPASSSAPATGFTLLQEGDDRAPVFLLPDSTASLRSLRALAARSDRHRTFLAARWTSIPDDERRRDLALIVDFFSNEIMELRPDFPISLVGHGFGGAAAFELAATLLRRGLVLEPLALLSSAGPQLTRAQRHLLRVPRHLANLAGRPVDQKVRYAARWTGSVVERALGRRAGWRRLTAGGELDDEDERLLASHERALRAWRARPTPLAATLLRPLSLPWNVDVALPEDLGWSGLFEGGLDVVELKLEPADLLSPGNIDALAAPLAHALQSPR
jgi:non-ribosomal peptide synthetase component F/thioesterase domain-containing protein